MVKNPPAGNSVRGGSVFPILLGIRQKQMQNLGGTHLHPKITGNASSPTLSMKTSMPQNHHEPEETNSAQRQTRNISRLWNRRDALCETVVTVFKEVKGKLKSISRNQ